MEVSQDHFSLPDRLTRSSRCQSTCEEADGDDGCRGDPDEDEEPAATPAALAAALLLMETEGAPVCGGANGGGGGRHRGGGDGDGCP